MLAMNRWSSSPTLGTLFSITYAPIAGMPTMAINKTMAVTMDTSINENPR